MSLRAVLETISFIFGSDHARLGVERLFELFQDIRLNKHLCHVRHEPIPARSFACSPVLETDDAHRG